LVSGPIEDRRALSLLLLRRTERYAAAVSINPLGRRGEPADIAAAAFWLASPEAAWVTGTILRADRGASAGTTTLPEHWPELTESRPDPTHPRTPSVNLTFPQAGDPDGYTILGAGAIGGTLTWHLAPGTWHLAPGTWPRPGTAW